MLSGLHCSVQGFSHTLIRHSIACACWSSLCLSPDSTHLLNSAVSSAHLLDSGIFSTHLLNVAVITSLRLLRLFSLTCGSDLQSLTFSGMRNTSHLLPTRYHAVLLLTCLITLPLVVFMSDPSVLLLPGVQLLYKLASLTTQCSPVLARSFIFLVSAKNAVKSLFFFLVSNKITNVKVGLKQW